MAVMAAAATVVDALAARVTLVDDVTVATVVTRFDPPTPAPVTVIWLPTASAGIVAALVSVSVALPDVMAPVPEKLLCMDGHVVAEP